MRPRVGVFHIDRGLASRKQLTRAGKSWVRCAPQLENKEGRRFWKCRRGKPRQARVPGITSQCLLFNFLNAGMKAGGVTLVASAGVLVDGRRGSETWPTSAALDLLRLSLCVSPGSRPNFLATRRNVSSAGGLLCLFYLSFRVSLRSRDTLLCMLKKLTF